MLVYSALRRTSDGFLVGLQTNEPALPPLTISVLVEVEPGIFEPQDVPAPYASKITAAQNKYGGTFEQYQMDQTAFNTAFAAFKAGQAAFASGSYPGAINVTTASAPVLAITNITGTNHTIECTFGGNSELVEWECISPDGVLHADSENATSGANTWIIEAGQVGVYRVFAEVSTFGRHELTFEVR